MAYIAGIDVGGTKCAALLGRLKKAGPRGAGAGSAAELSGMTSGAGAGRTVAPGVEIIDRKSLPTAAPGPTLEAIFSCVDGMLLERGVSASDLSGIGVSCGGPLDAAGGRILSPPNLPGWDDVPIIDMLRRRFGAPARLENDANACALAEFKFGAGRGRVNMAFLTFGTGLGAGLIINGELYRGASGMAGEVGHIRLSGRGPVGYGKAGSFEGFCSGGGISQLARQMALERIQMGDRPAYCPTLDDMPGVDARIVAEYAAAGDPLAQRVFAVSGEYLGRGLAALIDILNPELIIIGSIFARCERLLRPSMEAALAAEGLAPSVGACEILPAALGEDIGDYAALGLACE